jgi:hypothetical protein
MDKGAAKLAQRRKGDGRKLQMARRLRQDTTMTLNWIATRLKMGAFTVAGAAMVDKAAGSLANLLRGTERKR